MESASESEKVEQLYTYYGLLKDSSRTDIIKHEKVYEHIIKAVGGCEKEKRLACQFIPVFFKHFPDLADKAVDAQIDLCEDLDISIRKQAIKELPALCRDCPNQTKKVAFILGQLLVIKDQTELRIVHNSLMALFKIDAKAVFVALCNLSKVNDIALRTCALRFLSLRMRGIAKEIKEPEAEEALLNEVKQLLKSSPLEEIPLLIKISLSTNKCHTLQGRYDIANMLVEEVESYTPFDPSNEVMIERLIIILRHVHLLHSGVKKIRSNRFVIYMCEEVLPFLSALSGYKEGKGYALEILQLLAEITRSVDETTEWDTTINSILKILLEFLPTSDSEKSNDKVLFSYLECLLFTLHRLTKYNRSVFAKDPEKLKSFRIRLQQAAGVIKSYCDSLGRRLDIFFDEIPPKVTLDRGKRKWFKAVKYAADHDVNEPFFSIVESRMVIKWRNPSEGQDLTPVNDDFCEEVKEMSEIKKNCLRALAFDTCNNILILMRDFFCNPLMCDTCVQLSFFPAAVSDLATKEMKLKFSSSPSENSFSGGSSASRSPADDNTIIRPNLGIVRPRIPLYTPPSGRYSANFRRSN